MGLWIRSYLTQTLARVTLEELRHALDNGDFSMMAEWQELDPDQGLPEATQDSLRFEEVARSPVGWEVSVHYSHHLRGDRLMQLDVCSAPAAVRTEVEEALQREIPTPARACLQRVVETVAIELKISDAEGMGWPIAYYLSMWLAAPERGAGLVEYEGAWWDSRTYRKL